MTIQITICGGGNAAHTLAGILSSRGELVVHVFAPFDNEAERWQEGLLQSGGITVLTPEKEIVGRPGVISQDPGLTVSGSQLILLALPAFAHASILKQIAAYVSSDAWVGALPARGGFDLCVRDILKEGVSENGRFVDFSEPTGEFTRGVIIRVLELSGDPRSMGHQHGEQVADLRPQIQAAMHTRLAALGQSDEDLSLFAKEITKVWEQHAPNTLEMLLGIAEALDLEWGEYFNYTIAYYLTNRLRQTRQIDGCTTWAANGNITRDGEIILAKNRDYHPDHRQLQCLARMRPRHGYQYLCLTSAGGPGVFSSGVNTAGLAVADTYVSSNDLGPGIARYSLMMDILEKFANVPEAVNHLFTCPHFGDGTVTLADAQGELAVFEIAHSVQAVRQSNKDFIVSTNHFTAPKTRQCWVDSEPSHLQGNSQERRKRVENALLSARGQVDISWSQALMAQHGGSQSAICRHQEIEAQSMTISSVIFLPQQASLYIANGLPCQIQFELFEV